MICDSLRLLFNPRWSLRQISLARITNSIINKRISILKCAKQNILHAIFLFQVGNCVDQHLACWSCEWPKITLGIGPKSVMTRLNYEIHYLYTCILKYIFKFPTFTNFILKFPLIKAENVFLHDLRTGISYFFFFHTRLQASQQIAMKTIPTSMYRSIFLQK